MFLTHTQLGLPSLQSISRGNVRIQRCPHICDVKTFNWKKITNSNANYFYDYGQNCTRRPNQIYGPSNRICNTKTNETKCFTPVEKKPKNISLDECHELCILGCHNKTASGCFACKGPMDDGVCVESCPETK